MLCTAIRLEFEQDHRNAACSVGHIMAHALDSDVVFGKREAMVAMVSFTFNEKWNIEMQKFHFIRQLDVAPLELATSDFALLLHGVALPK